MSAEDLTRGFAALEDDEVRAAVTAGDLAAAGELDLDDEEQALLRAAASDESDVVGFGIHAGLLGFGPTAGRTSSKIFEITQDITVNKAKTADKAAQALNAYLKS